jgi:NAD(P)-dependent dehydrogenase (short-subunit alcohol dehydrogenase family)
MAKQTIGGTMKNQSYQNKVALVTGGTSGIGKATAIAFAEDGAKVVLTGRREKEGEAVVAEIKQAGGTAAFFQSDFSKETQVEAAVDFVVKTYGRLDVAFNNAGVEAVGPLSEITEEKYRTVFDINVWGVLCAMKHEIAAMLKTGGGAIVNTTSTFGHVGAAHVTIYVGSKHAVEGMTKCVALEFARQNIRVNTVSPAAIATDMIDRFAGKEGEIRDAIVAKHPVGRLGKPEEIAAAVLYLCSDTSKFTTGTSLKVDGGWLAQ